MANYFQDPSQSFVPTPVYRPPFEAIQSTLMAKQQKYDAGLANVQNIYNSVFNAPLTNGENSQVRAQFLTDAENKLKNLSQVDLSIESNQNEARNVFAPFYQDKPILADMVYTKQQGDEVNKFNSFKPDKDSNEYADQRNLANIRNGMEKVKNAQRGDMSVYQVRQFVPYSDLGQDALKAVTDTKFAVQTYNDNGTTTTTRTNGPGSVANFTTFIDGIFSRKYQNQFADEALYAKEQGIKKVQDDYARTNNGVIIDDNTALKIYAERSFATSYDQTKTMVDGYSESLKKLVGERDAIEEEMKTDPKHTAEEYASTLNDYQNKINGINDGLSEYNKSLNFYKKGTDEYQKNLDTWLSDPIGNLYTQIRTQNITNVAKALAANEKIEAPKVNEAFKFAFDAKQKAFENQIAAQGAEDKHNESLLTQKQQQYDLDHPDDKSKKNGKDATTTNPDGTPVVGADNPVYQGPDTPGVYKISPIESLHADKQAAFQQGVAPILDPQQIGGILSDIGKMPLEDTISFLDAVKSGKSYNNFTANEKAHAQQVKDILKDQGIDLKSFDQDAVAQAIYEYSGKILKPDNINTANIDVFKKYVSGFLGTQQAFLKYNDLVTAEKNAINTTINSKDFKHPELLIGDQGNKRVKTVDDLAEELPSVTIYEKTPVKPEDAVKLTSGELSKVIWNGGLLKQKTLTSKEFADAYLKGNISVSTSSTSSGNRYGEIPSLTLKMGSEETRIDENNPAYNDILKFVGKYGSSKQLNKNLKNIQGTIATNVNGYTPGEDGRMPSVYKLPLDQKSQKGTESAVQVISQITLPGNFKIPYDHSGNQITDNDVSSDLTRISKWNYKDIYRFLGDVQYKPQGINGSPSIVLSVRPGWEPTDDKDLTNIGFSKATIAALKNGVEFPINPSTTSPALLKLSHPNQGIYINSEIGSGKIINSTSFDEAMGTKFKLIPYGKNASAAKLTGSRLTIDPKTGNSEWIPFPDINLDFTNKTYDEAFSDITKAVYGNFLQNTNILEYRKQANQVKTPEQQKIADLAKQNQDYRTQNHLP